LKSERDVILRNIEPDFHVETTPLTGLDENESGRRESTDLVSTSKNFFAADARAKKAHVRLWQAFAALVSCLQLSCSPPANLDSLLILAKGKCHAPLQA
jgi:hypothetical protein